jgi:hypothetical protein
VKEARSECENLGFLNLAGKLEVDLLKDKITRNKAL